jgi:hypothetical protein
MFKPFLLVTHTLPQQSTESICLCHHFLITWRYKMVRTTMVSGICQDCLNSKNYLFLQKIRLATFVSTNIRAASSCDFSFTLRNFPPGFFLLRYRHWAPHPCLYVLRNHNRARLYATYRFSARSADILLRRPQSPDGSLSPALQLDTTLFLLWRVYFWSAGLCSLPDGVFSS